MILPKSQFKPFAEFIYFGSATDFCVDATVKGSVSRDFDVVVPTDAHTADDRPYIDAKNLVKQFNWNWGNFEVGARVLTVLPTADALKLL